MYCAFKIVSTFPLTLMTCIPKGLAAVQGMRNLPS